MLQKTSTSLSRPCTRAVPSCRSVVLCQAVNKPVVKSVKVEDAADAASPLRSASMAAFAFAAPMLMSVNDAMAAGGELGILEGRTAALIHPAVMGSLFVSSLYAGYLGWQWRRTRTVGDEIRELKKTLPAVGEDGVRPPSPVDSQITAKETEQKELVAGNFKDKHSFMGSILLASGERKKLVAGNYKDRHSLMGSILLASGVGIAIEGCANTYIRTGKLFPGPHLFAGATIVFLWAAAASLTPAMQKGDNNARNAHIALNSLNVALFAWQIPTER
eukprot:gene3326-13357_t